MSDHRRLATQREVALVDLVDRALNAGVVIAGDVTLSLADIDLVQVDLRLLVGSVATVRGDSPHELNADELLSVATRRERAAESGR